MTDLAISADPFATKFELAHNIETRTLSGEPFDYRITPTKSGTIPDEVMALVERLAQKSNEAREARLARYGR